MGPVGSGKSVGCGVAIYSLMRRFDSAGLPSRWVCVRNTYRELEDTLMRTWDDWFGVYGSFMRQNMTFTYDFNHRHEVLFRALDRPQDVGKLLSLEISGAWLNEVREIPRAIYDMVQTRIGRYPRREAYGDDIPPFSLVMDSNPMDDFHWYYRLAEEIRPDNAAFFRQPGGLDPEAENINNLPPDYYDNIAKGKDEAWLKVYVDGQYGFAVDGKPVYPAFKDSLHIQECETEDRPVICGMDFGLTPAAVFKQQSETGQWRTLSEIVTEDTAADEFGSLVLAHVNSEYRGLPIEYWGDPAGSQRSQADKNTPFRVLQTQGIPVKPAIADSAKPNDFDIRQKAVSSLLLKLDMAGEPAYIIHPRCKYLRRAMAGGYKYRQMQVSGDERYAAEPDKNIYSHVAEADQYAMIGGGQGNEVVGAGQWPEIDYSRQRRTVI